MSLDPQRVQSLFLTAVEAGTPAARAALLEQECGPDAELRRRVEALLRAHDESGSFLDSPSPDLPATVDDPIRERPGTVIGPYKLMEQIGEGGMGLVFVAEQQQPVRRKVALKVIKPGMDTRQVIARFEAERQALALMDHPHIAKVFDGGVTAEGRPYFVMELVKGKPITEYCDQNQIPIRQRLDLFFHVCQAVQHAHQKGIIHRDLKPSNVLVVSHDGTPVVKVIDFGVAKAIGQQLTDKTIYTQLAQMVGTPLYMSPEQAGQSGLDVDTRSDIYSLGVLLYELLTGTTPFDKERMRKAEYDEIRRIIREEEPPRPSTRISTLGQAATTVSTNRRSDTKQLSRLLRGELDWIVMKALEKDRNRRYDTVNAFAADVKRYLADEPVQACPPSMWYRFGKFTRRNRTRLVLAACVVTLVFGLAGSAVWLAVRQTETERGVTPALVQAKALLKVGDQQTNHPERWQATMRLARAAVEKAEGLLAAGVATEELAAQVRQVRAAVDAATRDSDLLIVLERIRLTQGAVNGKENLDNAKPAPRYVESLKEYGIDLAKPEEAAARVRESRMREALLSVLANWDRVSQDVGERQRAAEVYELALWPDSLQERLRAAIRRRDLREVSKLAEAPDLPLVSLAINAKVLAGMKEWAAAELMLRAGLERSPGDFWLNHELGRLLLDEQPPRAEEAVRYLTAALALRPDSPSVHLNLGLALHEKGDVAGAIRCYRAALRISPQYTMAHLDGSDRGRLDEAIVERRVAIGALWRSPEDHNNLGIARAEKAIAEHREAIRTKKAYPMAYTAHYNRGNALRNKGQLDEAIAEYQEAIRIEKDFPEAHLYLAWALHAKGRLDEAIAGYREAIHLKKDNRMAHYKLGCALIDKGQLDEAIAEFGEVIRSDPRHAFAAEAHCRIGVALFLKGQLDAAIAEYREAVRLYNNAPWTHLKLGQALRAKGLLDEAIGAYREAIRVHQVRYPGEAYPVARRELDLTLRMVGLDGKLPAILSGQKQPADTAERLSLAELCRMPYKKLYATAARAYSEAFAEKPQLADDPDTYRRYNAACVAALAAAGQGKDAANLGSKERGRLRRQALDWLRADLMQRIKQMENGSPQVFFSVQSTLEHWQKDSDLASVRGEAALAKLPTEEQTGWRQLWVDVKNTLAKMRQKNKQQEKSAKK